MTIGSKFKMFRNRRVLAFLVSGAVLFFCGAGLLAFWALSSAKPAKLSWDPPTVRKSLMSFGYKVYANAQVADGKYFLSKLVLKNTGGRPIHDLTVSYQIPDYIAWRRDRRSCRLSDVQFPNEPPGSSPVVGYGAFSMMRHVFGLMTLFLASLASVEVGIAAETINTDVVASVDPYGDGSMKMTFHLSASQWANWKQQYGDHPDVLWRDLKQKFAKYALVKFDLQKDEVERTATADIEARAFTRVRGDGTRGIEIPKEFRFISNSGREWVFDFTSQQSPYAPILAQMSRVILPAEATNAHIEEPGTGFQQIVYQMPDNSAGNVLLLGVALFAMSGGVVLVILGVLFSRLSTPIAKAGS